MHLRSFASAACVAAVVVFSSQRARAEPELPWIWFQPPCFAVQIVDLADTSFQQRVAQGGRYVDQTTPASSLGFSTAVAFGVTPTIHVDPFFDRHLGLVFTGGVGIFGVPPETNAALADSTGVHSASTGRTAFVVAGPEAQLAVADGWVIQPSIGVGYRALYVGSASSAGVVVQPRLTLNHFTVEYGGGFAIGFFAALDAVGPAGRTVTLGIHIGGEAN